MRRRLQAFTLLRGDQTQPADDRPSKHADGLGCFLCGLCDHDAIAPLSFSLVQGLVGGAQDDIARSPVDWKHNDTH